MRKLVLCLIVLLLAAMTVCIGYAENGSIDGIPQKVVDLLVEKGIEKQTLEDYISLDCVEAPTPLAHLFVLASKDGTHHTVYHFTNSESDENAHLAWKYKTSYDALAPQGKGSVCFRRHSGNDAYGQDCDISLYHDANGFTIFRIDPDHEEYWMQEVGIHVIDHQFQIIAWHDRNAADGVYAYVKNGKLIYDDADSGKKVGSLNLYRTYDLTTSFHSLPKTFKQAKEKITDPAVIPAGELRADLIKFTSNKKYAVYSAPDDKSLRASNSKAAVSTNDWIQVFGQEDDWILIQYAIDSNHYRFGYIPAKALPKKASVRQLGFDAIQAYTTSSVTVTDDPLYSQSTLIALPDGCRVTWLATMGEWAYIESSTGDYLRGFVPAAALRTERVFNLTSYPDAHGPVYNGKLTIRADRSFSASFSIEQAGSLGNAAVSAVVLYDLDGNMLCTAAANSADIPFMCTGVLNDSVTGIQFVAVDVAGNVLNNAVSVQW